MTRIDRYLVFLYFRVLAICFVSLAGLLIVVDVFANLEEFLRFTKQSQSTLPLVLSEYYGPYILWIFERLSGLLALMALLFVVAWLNKTNEFTALMAAGVAKRRVVRPMLICSALVILSAAGLRELAIPRFQDQLDRKPQDLTGDMPRPMRPTYLEQASVLFRGRHLLTATQEIVSPNIKVKGGPLADSVGSKLVAMSAFYHKPDHPSGQGYLLTQVTYPKHIDSIPSIAGKSGNPVLLTSHDTPWLESGQCFLPSDVEFELLRGGSAWKQFASTNELVTHLQEKGGPSGNDLRIKIHQRILNPATDWTVILLGIPVLLARPDRHMYWVAAACLFMVAGFTAIGLGLSALGASGTIISPMLACWLPLIVFLPFGWARTSAAMET